MTDFRTASVYFDVVAILPTAGRSPHWSLHGSNHAQCWCHQRICSPWCGLRDRHPLHLRCSCWRTQGVEPCRQQLIDARVSSSSTHVVTSTSILDRSKLLLPNVSRMLWMPDLCCLTLFTSSGTCCWRKWHSSLGKHCPSASSNLFSSRFFCSMPNGCFCLKPQHSSRSMDVI